MASTYSTNLAIELIGTGDQAGSWGNTTNTNLGTLIEQAISGYVTQAVSTGTDTTITIPNGATGVARNMYIELTGSGGASTNLIVPANKKLYFIFNNTSSGQVTVKVSGQTGVSVPNKAKMILVSNGTDIVDATNYIGNISAASANITVLTSASATITNLIATSASITTLTNNPTFGAGTANGVLYLNGSKVATSGSGMVFDGTRFFVGTTTTSTSSTQSGEIYSTGAVGFMLTNTTAANFPISIKNEGSSGTRNLIRFYEGPAGGTVRASVSLDGSNYLTFDTNNFIINTGNLGIGTTSPTSKLDLVGVMQWQATAGTVLGKLTYAGGEPVVLANTGLGLNLYTNNAFAARIDSSGNLGIGTASPGAKLHVLGSNLVGIFAGTNANTVYTEYRYNSTTTSGLIGNGSSLLSAAADSDFIVRSEGALKFATNGNNFRAVIDSSGNLGIGTASPADTNSFGRALDIRSSTGAAAYFRDSDDATKYSVAGFFGADSNAYYGSWGTGTGVLFYSAGSERARITSGGDFLTAGKITASSTTVGAELLANGQINTASANIDNLNLYNTTAAAYRFYVSPGGTVFATNTTISAISDQRLKENVRDLDVGLDAIMALKPRKFDWKEGKGQDKKDVRGFIAQEFEQVFPDLIDEWKDPAPEGEEPYKSVRQDLIPVLVKAIQELSAKVAALEAK